MPNIDYASGMPATKDYPILRQPDGQPGFGENQAFWIQDGSLGVHINGHLNSCEDVGAFEQRIGKLTIILPSGRTLLSRETGANTDEQAVASANLCYRCLEPFRRWSCHFEGTMHDITITRAYYSGAPLDYPRVPVRFDIETEMAAPAWIQGAFTEGGLGPVDAFIGGQRYEQLFRGAGSLTVGAETYRLSVCGNRTHRIGRRNVNASADAPRMMGHVWAAAIFPSGAGFGFQIYPKPDGSILWGEGYVTRDGRLVPAEVVAAPWLRSYRTEGERLDIVLKTRDGGTFEIEGETLGAFVGQMTPGATPGDQIPLFQSYARFTMRGETAVNMIERSLRRSCIETGIGRPG